MQMTTAFEESLLIRDDQSEAIPIAIGFQPTAFVIYTTAKRTLRALEKANEIVKPGGGRIEVVALQVVPRQLLLDQPPVHFEIVMRHFKEMAERLPIDLCIHTYLCREPWGALRKILPPDAPIVIGVRKRWWPTREKRLAGRLRRAGFQVIPVESE
jgi:hypothetical protein